MVLKFTVAKLSMNSFFMRATRRYFIAPAIRFHSRYRRHWCTSNLCLFLFTKGYFIRPTVIAGLPDSSACMQEEIFGPVVCVTPFDTEEEVIERANNVTHL